MPLARAPIVLLAVLLAGCAEAFAPVRDPLPKTPEGHFLVLGDTLQVTGTAEPDMKLATETQRRSEAADNALRDAWRRLKEYLEGLRRPDGTIRDLAAAHPYLGEQLEKLVYSSRSHMLHFDEDGTAAVTIRIRKDAINKALGTDFR